MALKDDVLAKLKEAGDRLRKDLWHPEDLKTLAMIAEDLVGLSLKAQQANDGQKKRRYLQAAGRLADHAALLALSRLNVIQNDVAAAIKDFFLTLVKEWLPKLLAGLVGAL
jgi:hypothetical protein